MLGLNELRPSIGHGTQQCIVCGPVYMYRHMNMHLQNVHVTDCRQCMISLYSNIKDLEISIAGLTTAV